jgi:hypothetical protein
MGRGKTFDILRATATNRHEPDLITVKKKNKTSHSPYYNFSLEMSHLHVKFYLFFKNVP